TSSHIHRYARFHRVTAVRYAARETRVVTQPYQASAAGSQGSFNTAPGDPVLDSFSFDKQRDPRWFKRALFYEVLVRGYHDSNGDGTGALPGLTSRLDYLQWLGVDCIWLLPIYTSPLRDGGYDISDFTSILPEFGILGDFVDLVDQAHE